MSRALEAWAFYRGIQLDFTRPGKPTDNSHIESFNGRLRDECLNVHLFFSLADGSLGQLTPSEFVTQRQQPRPSEAGLVQD
jgi:putative transposase